MDTQLTERELARRAQQRDASLAANSIAKMSLSVVEAAHRAGVSVSYMNRLRVTGGGCRYAKIGRRVTYDPDDIDAWLASLRRHSTSESAAA